MSALFAQLKTQYLSQVAPFLPNLSTKRRDKKEALSRFGLGPCFPPNALAAGPPELHAGGAHQVSKVCLDLSHEV